AGSKARVVGVAARWSVMEGDELGDVRARLLSALWTNTTIRAGRAVVYRLYAEAAEQLRPGGSLWAEIRKKQGAESAKRELAKHFRNVTRVEQKKGYWILKADR